MSAAFRAKALGYLRGERVRVISATTPEGHLRPYEVLAYVRGHQDRHAVRFDAGAWSCSCGSNGCAHVAAVQLVTGWPSAASKGGA